MGWYFEFFQGGGIPNSYVSFFPKVPISLNEKTRRNSSDTDIHHPKPGFLNQNGISPRIE